MVEATRPGAHSETHTEAHETHESGWPILLAIGSAIGLMGFVFGWPLFFLGVVVLGYSVVRWLRDDLFERFHGPRVDAGSAPFERVENRKLGMWLLIASEVLLFSGLIGTYVTYRARNPGLPSPFEREMLNPLIGGAETYVLLTSSLALVLGLEAAHRERRRLAALWLAVTLALGLSFLSIKAFDWNHITHEGFTPWRSMTATLFFTITGVHGAHVLGGCIGLVYLTTKVAKGGLLGVKALTIEYFGIYWHFVDIVWVFLFPLFYLI